MGVAIRTIDIGVIGRDSSLDREVADLDVAVNVVVPANGSPRTADDDDAEDEDEDEGGAEKAAGAARIGVADPTSPLAVAAAACR